MLPRLHLGSLAIAVLVASVATPEVAAERADNERTTRLSVCVPGSIRGLRTDRLSYAVTAVRPLDAHRALAARASTRFGVRNVNGVATVFGVLAERVDRACQATHYEVQLPIRPNGSTGWVRAVDVRLRLVRTRVAVDLSTRRITRFRDGQMALITTAVIGAASTPTPTGQF